MRVAIAIPSIAPRFEQRVRAIQSVCNQQTVHDVEPVVTLDTEGLGAWGNRNRCVEEALLREPDWVGFLDDDDELLPHHVQFLIDLATEHDAAFAWGWFQIIRHGKLLDIGEGSPFPQHRGKQYDPAEPRCIPITYMVRADVLRQVWGFGVRFLPDKAGAWENQDQPLIDAIYEASDGAFIHSPHVTWHWHHHGLNTSGLPRWKNRRGA